MRFGIMADKWSFILIDKDAQSNRKLFDYERGFQRYTGISSLFPNSDEAS